MRPKLCSKPIILNYIIDNFPLYMRKNLILNVKPDLISEENEMQLKKNLFNFFNDLEKLSAYKNFFSKVEEKTKNTDYKVNIKNNVGLYNFDNSNLIQEIYNFYQPGAYFGQTAMWFTNNMKNIPYNLYQTFLNNTREGEIFINDQLFTEFKIIMENHSHSYSDDMFTEIKLKSVHYKMRKYYSVVRANDADIFIKNIIKSYIFKNSQLD